MVHSLAPYNRLVVCALISTFLSPADSSFKTRISDHLAPNLALPLGHRSCSSPDWLEYMYRTRHPVLRWLPTKLAEII